MKSSSLFGGSAIAETRVALKEAILPLFTIEDQVSDPAIFETVQLIIQRLEDPYTFVIVGEVKAGKSSFINALLATGEDICAVAPSPMTDTIQLITYGKEKKEEIVNPYFKKVFIPEPILKEIGIVDTPGTNTIVAHHQEITERFIPTSDLIVFVFEAKNPYRESAWTFFDFIHSDWHKKILFVLQQKDLLPEADLHVNEQGVYNHAISKGLIDPKVFSVSAKLEQEGRTEQSGFLPIRSYIQDHITGGKAPRKKLNNARDTIHTIINDLNKALQTRKDQLMEDQKFLQEIHTLLEKQTEKSKQQVNIFTENITHSYANIGEKYLSKVKEGLSFFALLRRSFSSLFGSKKNLSEWVKELGTELESELNQTLQSKLSEGMIHLSDAVQQMGLLIDAKIRERPAQQADGNTIFQDSISQRDLTLGKMHESFSAFIQDRENFIGTEGSNYEVSSNIATGSGIAVIGVMLSALASGMVFDITGGVITAIGLVFAGVSAGLKRSKVVKDFRSEINQGRDQLDIQLREKLTDYVDDLRVKISEQVAPFESWIDKEQKAIHQIDSTLQSVDKNMSAIKV